MNQTDLEMSNDLREIMVDFLIARRDAKLEKLKPDDPKHEELHAQYELQTWLTEAARRVSQIQVATHTLKAIHPDARGTNLYCPSSMLPDFRLVGSHLLGDKCCADVIGNAAALDVNKFLAQKYQDKTILAWMQENEEVVVAAFHVEDVDMAHQWVRAFLGLIRSPDKLSSHSLAKQLYWLTGEDPGDDAQYHLLAPLYASSLAHSVYASIQEHRFGDDTKAAREAKKQNALCEHILHEYPNIAIQKMGGTKPQNISQLNSERKGVSYLLPSCPPHWRSTPTKPLYGVSSLFERFGRQKDIKNLTRELRGFLESDPEPNQATRDHRDDLVDRILIKLLQNVEKIRTLPPGWTADSRCRLVEAEQCWLDPQRVALDAEFAATWLRLDWPQEVKSRFGNWLNAMLGGKLPLGDIEHEYWADFSMMKSGDVRSNPIEVILKRRSHMSEFPNIGGLLILPRLRVQNANAISAPMTWGFPSMTAFLGLMWALERAMAGKYPLLLNAVGVVCHAFEPQVSKGGFTKSFCLTRNPVSKDGGSASITEEGRVHLEVTLVFGVGGELLAAPPEDKDPALQHIAELLSQMRIAGGTLLPGSFSRRPELIALADDAEKRQAQFRKIRRNLLPGFCLVERNDLLDKRHQQLLAADSEATRLDAWLDLSRINWSSSITHNDDGSETVVWRHDRDTGWIVPIPLGYAALTDVQKPGSVMNARDTTTPFRFVESVYGIGQWIGPHRLNSMRQMLWYASSDIESGLYRCCNDYTQNL